MDPGPASSRLLPRAAFAVAVLVSLVVLFAPADDVPAALPGVDKVVHVALFAVLAATGRWAGMRPWVLAGGLALYAGASEVLQAVTPLARSGSPADLLADLAGVALGLVAWSVLRRAPAPGSLGR
jgi:hypothetical protein